MNEIEIPQSHATVAETSDLATNSSEIIKKHALEDEYLNQLGDSLGAKGEEMEKSIATSRKKELTEELTEADNKRDGAFIALKLFIQGYIKWNIEKFTQYAQKIWEILKRHGLSLDREPYKEESGLLESLFIDLEKPEIVEAITILNQNELISYLKESQTEFRALYQKSLETEAGKKIVVSVTELKKTTLSTLKKMTKYLNSMAQAKPDVYTSIQREMAELINNLNQKL